MSNIDQNNFPKNIQDLIETIQFKQEGNQTPIQFNPEKKTPPFFD